MVKVYQPINTLKSLGPNIWIVDGGIIKMTFAPLIKVPFSTRMTVIRLADQSLVLHSPIEIDAHLIQELQAIGEIKYFIAPNQLHYAYLPDWQKKFPKAETWYAPGVVKRAQAQGLNLSPGHSLTDQVPGGWEKDLDQLIFKGSRLIEEAVFFHKESRTLILTDLIENFDTDYTKSKLLKTVQKLGKIAAPKGSTPIDYRLTFWGQKAQARESVETILSWQPEQIVVSHGEIIESHAVDYLNQAFSWVY